MTTTTHLRACHLCEAACGLEITVTDGAVTRIAGDPLDPLSHGHICPKGTALADLQSDPDRLRTPMRRVGSDWQPLGWDEALDEVAARLADIRQRHGADAVAYYRGNPSAHNLGAMTHQSGFVKALGSRNIFSPWTRSPTSWWRCGCSGTTSSFPCRTSTAPSCS
jgi:anaerobic selenocysteine-containing dehydrogenase